MFGFCNFFQTNSIICWTLFDVGNYFDSYSSGFFFKGEIDVVVRTMSQRTAKNRKKHR